MIQGQSIIKGKGNQIIKLISEATKAGRIMKTKQTNTLSCFSGTGLRNYKKGAASKTLQIQIKQLLRFVTVQFKKLLK